MLIPPILIVGTNRSGKSLLASCFSRLSNSVIWWSEPNTIWRTQSSLVEGDRRIPEEATVALVRKIRNAYLKKQKASGNKRIVDDSPLHCINMPFVQKVLPEAKVIHIFRNGISVVSDLIEDWKKPRYPFSIDTLRFVIRRMIETPFSEWRLYSHRVLKVMASKVGLYKLNKLPLGIRYPGIEYDLKYLDNIQLACRQWQVSQSLILNDLLLWPQNSYVCVAYEEFVRSPVEIFTKLLSFVGLSMSLEVEIYLREDIITDYLNISHTIRSNEMKRVDLEKFLEPTLSRVQKLANPFEFHELRTINM